MPSALIAGLVYSRVEFSNHRGWLFLVDEVP